MNKKFYGFLLVFAALFCVGTFESCKDTNSDELKELQINHQKQLDALEGRIAKLEAISHNCTDICGVEGGCAALPAKIEAAAAAAAAAKEAADTAQVAAEAALDSALVAQRLVEEVQIEVAKAKATADSIADVLKVYMDETDTELVRLDEAIQDLDTRVSGTEDKVEKLTKRVEALESQVENLTKWVASLSEQISQRATGISVQAVYNPVLGSVNTPWGVNNGSLVAYYANFDDVKQFGGKKIYGGFSDAEDNAGKIYLTINPVSEDFTGVKLNLVNSQGEPIGVILSDVKKSDKVLTFGIDGTRSEDTYLYETSARIETKNLGLGYIKNIALHKSDFVAAAKDVVNYKDGINFSILANLALTTINNTKVEAGILSMCQGDSLTQAAERKIAAISVTPLNINHIKGLGKYIAKAQKALEVRLHYLQAKLNGVNFDVLTGEDKIYVTVEVNETVTIDVPDVSGIEAEYDEESGEVIVSNNGSTVSKDFDVEFEHTTVVDINDYIDLGAVKGGIQKVEDIRGLVDLVINKAIKGLDFADRLVHLYKPVLFALDSKGTFRVLTPYRTNVLKDNKVVLFPTSYCLESLVPYYQKCIYVEDGDAILTLNGEVVNNTAFDGYHSLVPAQFSSREATLVYRVMDYGGNVETITYKIAIAE